MPGLRRRGGGTVADGGPAQGRRAPGVEPTGAEGGEPTASREPEGGDVTELLRRRARQQRQRRRWQVAVGAAAGIVLIGGGIGVGIAAAPQHGPPAPPPLALTGQLHSATDPGTGVAGTVGLVAKAWGTQVTLDLSKVRGPAECELVAVSRTGERRVVMGWLVAAPGDGVPGHPAHLVIRGGTSIPRSDLARVDVDVVNGRTLVSIPVSSGGQLTRSASGSRRSRSVRPGA